MWTVSLANDDKEDFFSWGILIAKFYPNYVINYIYI